MANNLGDPFDSSEKQPNSSTFQSLSVLIGRWRDGTFREIIDDWKWIFTYTKRYKGAVIYYTILGIASVSMGLVSTYISRPLLNIFVTQEYEKIPWLVLWMVATGVFGLIFRSITSRVSAKLSIFINNDVQADIFDQIMDTDWMALNQYTNGDILNRFNQDVTTVSSNAISWVPTIVISLFQFAATFIVMLRVDMGMAWIAFASAPFMLLVSKFVVKKQRDYNRKVRELGSKMMEFEVETFYNFDTIKSFGITDNYGKKLRWWQEKFKDISLLYNLFTIKTNVYMSSVGLGVQLIAFFYCLAKLLAPGSTFYYGDMSMLLSYRSQLSGAFNSVVGLVPNFLQSSVSAHRVREMVDLPKEVHISESHELDQYKDDGFTVEMRWAQFAYVENNRVIKDSDFIAKPGEIVALVGPSGEGKTTMLRLILGLIRPQEGEVVLRASNGQEIGMNAETRHLFSYVPQGNTVVSGTIAENMRMVEPDATDEEIIEALKVSCAWDFVKEYDDTIDHMLGTRGRGLSEGQAQRISIARAILRDAPLLLLDEATSALDVATERKVLKNIVQQRPNKTIIVTTHRPSVLNMCQRVYRVMQQKVTELDEAEAAKMSMDF